MLLLLSEVMFILCRSQFDLSEQWNKCFAVLASMSLLNPVGSFFFPVPLHTPLPFSLFRFLASDTSSSSLSRTESPLQLFVSSHLPHPHPKPDIFVWPHAASPYCDQVPEPCSPAHCKLAFYSWWACLCCIILIIFTADKLWLNGLRFNSVREIWPFGCFSLNTAWVLRVSSEKTVRLFYSTQKM